jgi:phosphatidylglycerophosphatase A
MTIYSPPEPVAPKPQAFSWWLATSGGLGLLPKAPGTWGSLAGLALAWLFQTFEFRTPLLNPLLWWVLLSAAGVWAASRVEQSSGKKDPQEVVIDEVSGQWLALLASPAAFTGGLGWKSFLAGLILFRVLDITKPFPARQMESLPGGWGIMADDWVAGAYAAGLLWLAHAAGF